MKYLYTVGNKTLRFTKYVHIFDEKEERCAVLFFKFKFCSKWGRFDELLFHPVNYAKHDMMVIREYNNLDEVLLDHPTLMLV